MGESLIKFRTADHFINVVDHHAIEASFRVDDGIDGESCYTITAESGANGSISPVGNVFVTAGGVAILMIILILRRKKDEEDEGPAQAGQDSNDQ